MRFKAPVGLYARHVRAACRRDADSRVLGAVREVARLGQWQVCLESIAFYTSLPFGYGEVNKLAASRAPRGWQLFKS